MKLKNIKLFEEREEEKGLRNDEFSHLNDGLNGYSDDDYDDDYDALSEWEDDIRNRDSRSTFRDEEFENDEFNDDQEEEMKNLASLLRKMFHNSGIRDIDVETEGLDIRIYIFMLRRESMRSILKVLEVADKLRKDILSAYESEFEVYTAKNGRNIFCFNFTFGDGMGDENLPF